MEIKVGRTWEMRRISGRDLVDTLDRVSNPSVSRDWGKLS